MSIDRPGLINPQNQSEYKHDPFKFCDEFKKTEKFEVDNELLVDKSDALYRLAEKDERAAPLELLSLDSEVASQKMVPFDRAPYTQTLFNPHD